MATFLENSASLVSAILGILKAGKFYVPLDAAQPLAAGRAMLEDSSARLVLTDGLHLSEAHALADGHAVVVNIDDSQSRSCEGAAVPGAPDIPAYVYYTSGSTGRPKGVLDTQRNVLHNVMRYTNSLFFSPEDRLTLIQRPAFSGAVSSMFGALLNGAAVCIFDPLKKGIHDFADWLRRECITVCHSVPALFRLLMEEGGPFPSLRVVRLEGDRASWRDVELFSVNCPGDCVLVNGLGATECGLVRQFFIAGAARGGEPAPNDRLVCQTGHGVPLGYEVKDMEVLILDDNGHTLPDGEIGEIAVASCFLAEGYWGRPDLTAAAFIAPSGSPDQRLYRTGDLGRLDADGCLHCLGRRDDNLKVAGARIDTAAVEATLASIEDVKEAVVVTREDPPGEVRLVAYVVCDGREFSPGHLRKALSQTLPAHMMPSAFVPLERLPLSANGKVDRKALPAPPRTRPDIETPYRAAGTPVEATLCRLWADVLGLDGVGVDDPFLALGGDSLKAMRLAARVRDAFEVAIDLPVLLSKGTVAQMALAVAAALVGDER